jgi:DNA-directed RNA polymerase subunit RPC12/RpoP
MAEFINLVCPSCGGKLKIFPNTTVLTCQHCGNEHMIKHDAGGAILLEAFARCPVCGRNDKVEKVTAVLAHQSQEITGTEQKTEVKTDSQGKQHVEVKEVPFSRIAWLNPPLPTLPTSHLSPSRPNPYPSQAGSLPSCSARWDWSVQPFAVFPPS